ncbi:hypothetical protein AB833_09150 [Chromatiales bacterium (ex Bugula neritina AB1)]|nr:hypothetical protein AB833_09150 [Chromatiales bacterium (ex Bugula neritina AB1)]
MHKEMVSDSPVIQLYAFPDTYSIGVHLLLEEAAVPYRIVNPKLDPSQTDEAFYRASPHGRVPAIIMPDGTTLCESGAILLHLADGFSAQQFTVAADSADRGRYLQWLFYLSSTLQPEVMIIFHPEYYSDDRTIQAELTASAQTRLRQVLTVLEKQYQNRSWMFAKGPTAVDFALANVLLWPECFSDASKRYPSLALMLDAISGRSSLKRIIQWHRGETDVPPQNHKFKSLEQE